MLLKEFENWLLEFDTTKKGIHLSQSTAYKYSRAINTISNEMIENKIIDTNIINIIDWCELEELIIKIKNSDIFISKNDRGNKMYSNALDYYLIFIKNKNIRH